MIQARCRCRQKESEHFGGSDLRQRGEAVEAQKGWPPTTRQNLRLDISQPCANKLSCLPEGPVNESDLNLNLLLARRNGPRVQVASLQQAKECLCRHAIEAIRARNHGWYLKCRHCTASLLAAMGDSSIEQQYRVVAPVRCLAVELEGEALQECGKYAAVDRAMGRSEIAGSKVVDGCDE